MPITLIKVETRSQLKAFIEFPYTLYKGCDNSGRR